MNDLMTISETATYLKMSRSAFFAAREQAGFPPAVRLSARKVFYRQVEIEAWVAER